MAVYKRKKKLKSGRKQTYYFYKFDYNGRTYQGSPEIHTAAAAKRAENEAWKKAERGVSNKAPTMAEFLEKSYWPYAKAHKADAGREHEVVDDFITQYAGWRLDEFKASHIREFLDHRAAVPTQHKKTRSKETINREHSILSSVFSFAITEEWLTDNPCTRVKRYKKPPSRLLYWTLEEEAKVMPFLINERSHLRLLVIVAIYSGLRREEFLSLKAEHCDFENGIIHAYSVKTGTWRYVAMEPNVYAELKSVCASKRPADYLFINPKTGTRFYDPKKGIKKAAELAGVKCIDWHGLRHTRGTRLAMRGMNAFQIAAELGHGDIRTSQQYIHLAEAAQRAAEARKLSTQLIDTSTKDLAKKSLENRWNEEKALTSDHTELMFALVKAPPRDVFNYWPNSYHVLTVLCNPKNDTDWLPKCAIRESANLVKPT